MAKVILLRNLSCSGGTYIASVLTARTDVHVINEFHPFEIVPRYFSPNSIVGNLLNNGAKISNDTLLDYCIREVNGIQNKSILGLEGDVFIRWHSYFDYLTPYISNPSRVNHFNRFVEETGSQVITILRDPLTSYVSNVAEGFIKTSLREYLSSYHQFVEESDSQETYKYEEITSNMEAFEAISIKLFGDWDKRQLKFENWKPLSGTKHLKNNHLNLVNMISWHDAERILNKFKFTEFRDATEQLQSLNEKLGYDSQRFESSSYGDLMLARLRSPIEEILQERDSLIQERDSLIQERDSLIQERDSLIQERESIWRSRSWKITAPLRKLTKILRVLTC